MGALRQSSVVYRLVLACVAVAVVVVSVRVRPLTHEVFVPLLVLLGLGILSGTTLDDAEGVTYSFTSFVLASSFALVGPTGAVIIAAIVPLFLKRGRWTSLHLFNTSLTVVVAGGGGLSYLMSSGWLPLPETASPAEFLLHVGFPLLVANIVVLVLNALLIAIVIHVDGGQFRYVLAGSIRQTAPLYLGYAVLAFLFVMLWGPGQLYELSVAFIMAPLLIARWSYTQYGEQFRAHNRILDTLATAGDGWDRGGTGHGTRVDQFAQLMVEPLGLTFSEQRDLRYASKLHDIGRLGTPRKVVEKPMSAPDDHDRAIITQHPILAAEIVGGIEFLAEAARDIRHHHERPDGLGYPDGLVGDQIPLVSRVLAVADAFDALTSGAGSLPALEPEEALAELRRGAGAQFDVRCVEALAHVLGRTVKFVEPARRGHDDGPWRDHDDPRLGHLLIGHRPGREPSSPVEPG